MLGPYGARSAEAAGRAGEIKGWVSRAFELDAETVVTVMELRCSEPGCPPVETAVGILGEPGGPRQLKVHKPMAEVGFEDVERLAEAGDRKKAPEAGAGTEEA